jgi:hypothetical protein
VSFLERRLQTKAYHDLRSKEFRKELLLQVSIYGHSHVFITPSSFYSMWHRKLERVEFVPFEDPMFACSFDALVPSRFFVAFIEFVVLMCSSSNWKRIVFL